MAAASRRKEGRQWLDAMVEAVDPPVDGYVVDLSSCGARVVLFTDEPIGSSITLSFRLGEKTTIAHCRVRWQRDLGDRIMVGLEFGRQ